MVNPFSIFSRFVKAGGTVSDEFSRWMTQLLAGVNATPGNSVPVTFAQLPTSAPGAIYVVTDSTTLVWGAVIAGGGANTVGAFYNGTDWRVCAR